MVSAPLLLVGAGGLAREVHALLRESDDREVVGILDDADALQGTRVGGLPVLGGLECARRYPDVSVVVCAGEGRTRAAIVGRLQRFGVTADRYATVLDPSVRVPSDCTIGAGSILLARTVLTADVTIGRHVVTMPHVVLTHDDVVDDFATLCAGVALGGRVSIGSCAYLGMNSSVRQHLRVGEGATLGMGSVLVSNLPAGQVWAGVPARVLARVEARS